MVQTANLVATERDRANMALVNSRVVVGGAGLYNSAYTGVGVNPLLGSRLAVANPLLGSRVAVANPLLGSRVGLYGSYVSQVKRV
jgi:hypothetical protein